MVRSPVHANATRGKYETAYCHEVAKEFGHTALWRLMYLAGGCVAVLSFYLAARGQAFDQLPPSPDAPPSQRVQDSAVWLRVMTTAPPPRGF